MENECHTGMAPEDLGGLQIRAFRMDESSEIPEQELSTLTSTVEAAGRLARRGELEAGRGEILYQLRRVRLLAIPWPAELVRQYQAALVAFDRDWRHPLE